MDEKTREIKDPVVRRVVEMLAEKGLKDKDLTDYLGLAAGSMSRWKYEGKKAYLQHVVPICEFLDITPTYLFYGTVETGTLDALTPAERELLKDFQLLDSEKKKCVQNVVKLLLK